MGREETLAAVREKYPQYADMGDVDLGNALAKKYPAYADLAYTGPRARKLPSGEYDLADPNVYKDPDALKVVTEQSRLGGVLAGTEKPKGFSEAALQGVGAIPMVAAGGALGGLAKVAPFGRMATEGGLSWLRGDDWLQTAVNVAGAGIGEAATAVAGKALGAIAGPATREMLRGEEAGRVGREIKAVIPQIDAETDRALFGVARKESTKALDAVMASPIAEIKKRLGPVARFAVPSLGTTRVSLDQAIDGMWAASKETRPLVRAEIIAKLNQLDPQKQAGLIFDEALKQRAAARTYLGIVDKALDKNGHYDPVKAAQYVNQNYAKLQRFAGNYWPRIESVILKGEKAPVEIPGRPSAMRVLGHRVEVPMWASEAARRAQPVEGTKAAVDAFLGTPPFSAVAVGAMGELAKPIARHVPGGREAIETVEEAAE